MGAYGYKATIGFIGPPRTNETVLAEAFRLVQPGVTWAWSTMGLSEFGQKEFDHALSLAHLCAKELASREVSIIVMAGIPLMTSKGAPYHERLARELADAIGPRVPVTTDIACVIAALRALKMERIALSSIYQRYIQDNVIRYLEHYGIRTLGDETLAYALAECMTGPTMNTAYEASRKALDKASDADGLFIACPQWPVIDHIERLEKESGKPVVTHLTAIMWGALAQIGVRVPFGGYGEMLSRWPAWPEVQAAHA
jgi:maleate cis-trans isomerase